MNRLLRTCSAALLACALAVPAAALETPLVLPSGNSVGSINAGSGQVIIYEVATNTTTRKGQANFLTDLQVREARVTMVGEQPYSQLRTGWGPSKDALPSPTPEECISKWFLKELSPAQKKAGRTASDQELVRKAEDDFWSKDHPYDGVVRGAFGGTKLMLVVPSKRVALFYQIDSQDATLVNVYNYSPALYVQLGQNTSPRPDELAARLDLPKEQKEDLVGQFKQQEDNAALQAAPSEAWCAVTQGSSPTFCLVDTANRRILTFEEKGRGMSLKSVRNISTDLAIPTLWQSTPDAVKEASEVARACKDLLAEWGVPVFDQYTLKALVAMAQAGEGVRKAEALQANIAGNLLVLDFTAQRKLLTYNANGAGNGIELVTVRDYSFDLAADMLRTRHKARIEAAANFKAIEAMAGKGQADKALQMLRNELKFVPSLVDVVRKSAAFRKFAGKDKEALDALVVQADKDKEAFLAQVKTAVEQAAAEREKAKKDKR